MQIYIIIFFAVLNVAFAQRGSHDKYGVPTGNLILSRPGFMYSMNLKTGFADWVIYRLGNDDFGGVPRWDKEFFKDSLITQSVELPDNDDYENSGYDRGHLVRSEERTTNSELNRQTFVLSNVIPQTPDLNRGPWLKLERWAEKVCKDSTYEMWVISGPIFDEPFSRLNNKYLIPKFCFKVFLVKYKNGKFKKFGVIMPNITGIRDKDWQAFLTPIRVIEKATKLKFFQKYK